MRAAILGSLAASRHGKADNNNTVNNPDANATPARPRPSRPPLRAPLQSRDGNVKMRVPPQGPLAGKSPKASMPSYDKKSAAAAATTRTPLAPTLSASAKAANNNNKTPLTPRVAGSSSPAKTPLSQRKARPELTTPVGSSRKDLTTPVSTFMSNNITPRSGLRKSRVESTNSTPLGTPTASGTPGAPPSTNGPRLARLAKTPGSGASGLGSKGLNNDTPTRNPAPFSPSGSEMGYPRSPAANSPADAKFFYASEAKSSPADAKFFYASEAKSTPPQAPKSPARPPLRTKTSNSSFCYANGETVPDVPRSSGSAVGSLVGGDRSHHRLFNTNAMSGMHSSSASAVGSMVGGERTNHRPFHVQEGSISHRSPSALGPRLGTPVGSRAGSRAGSMVGEDMPHHNYFRSNGEYRPRGPGSALGSMVGSMVGSERSHSQFFHANGEPDETPDSPCGSAVGSMAGSMFGEDRFRPKFFHANDVVPRSSGRSVVGSTIGSTVGSTVGDEAAHPKFYHANGTPDLDTSPSVRFAPPARASSTVSSSSRITSPRLVTFQSGVLSPTQRPPSPSKLRQQSSTSSVRNKPSPPSQGVPRPQQTGRGQSASSIVHTRRASIETAHRVVSHTRSISFDSKPETCTPPTRKYSGASSFGDHPSSPLNMITHPVPVSTPEEVLEAEVSAAPSKDGISLEQYGPIKTGQSIETLNELAAKARRERKVLDLEITNSSLEAINRTLEREMRKQTAELRRYRRLSRSGRLSIATSISMHNSNGLNSVIEGDDRSLLNLSEDDDDSQAEESEFSDEETSQEGSLSPRAVAESDARHRSRDEKRLQLDLSKHQQLLIDSQKMNQSLKRCLGWTEELINEGRKALAYHVRVSEVEFGGRVLAADEVDANRGLEDVGEDNEGMSEIGAQMLREARRAAKESTASNAAKEDRDSGVELDGPQDSNLTTQYL